MNDPINSDLFERAKAGETEAKGHLALEAATVLCRRLRLSGTANDEAIANVASKLWLDGQAKGFQRFSTPGHLIAHYGQDRRKLRKLAFPDKASLPLWQQGPAFSPIDENVVDHRAAPTTSVEARETRIEGRDKRRQVRKLLQSLPFKERAIVTRWADGGPNLWRRIAAALGLGSSEAARSRFRRILAELRLLANRVVKIN